MHLPNFTSTPRAHGFTKALSNCLVSTLLVGIFAAGAVAERSRQAAPIRVKGSFVIAAICKDGIIVASDSRGMLKDRQGRRVAYYDLNQKIFPLGNNLIADTGYASLNDSKISFLSALMFRFANNSLSHVDISQLPSSYFRFAGAVLSPTGAESAKLQTLVFAGFEENQPMLCIYQGESSRSLRCSFSGYVSSPNQKIRGLENVRSLSFQEAAHIMQRTIEDYASAVQPGFVGGPVVIRTITRSGSNWFGVRPDWPNWNSFTDLAEDYRRGRVSFNLMPGIMKVQLDTLVEEGAAWTRRGQASTAKGTSEKAPVIGSLAPAP